MNIIFGLTFDDEKQLPNISPGDIAFGFRGLVAWLEGCLGFQIERNENTFIRVEQYRQVLDYYVQSKGEEFPFFYNSFKADPLATSEYLLELREDLVMGFWDFKSLETTPLRLKVFSELESLFQTNTLSEKGTLPFYVEPSFADRFIKVFNALNNLKTRVTSLVVKDEQEIIPTYLVKLFDSLANNRICVEYKLEPFISKNTDLGQFQKQLRRQQVDRNSPNNDGSLIVVEGDHDSQLADWLARFLIEKPDFRPSFIIPRNAPILDSIFNAHGLPSFGLDSDTKARPGLQIIKLVPAFFWKPLDPNKILEFVSLKNKPLDRRLSFRLSRLLSNKPGIGGEEWNQVVNETFDNEEMKEEDRTNAIYQYKFWFARDTYDVFERVPVVEFLEAYTYLRHWALEEVKKNRLETQFVMLASQCLKIVEMLEIFGNANDNISYLQLDQIIRLVYSSTPTQIYDNFSDSYKFYSNSGSVINNQEELIFWNFNDLQTDYFFSAFYEDEIAYLNDNNVKIQTPKEKNELINTQKRQAILRAKKIILFVPKKIAGDFFEPNSLLGDLESTFKNSQDLFYHFSSKKLAKKLDASFFFTNSPIVKEILEPILSLNKINEKQFVETSSVTGLINFLYYPHIWFFKDVCKLPQRGINAIKNEGTLKGILAHRFFELLFKKDGILNLNKQDLNQAIDSIAEWLFPQEGLVFLQYGKEPDLEELLQIIKDGFYHLANLINDNGWKIFNAEYELEGKLKNVTLRGVADLVLVKNDQYLVIDLKYGGNTFRKNLIKNRADIQLTAYSKLLNEKDIVFSAFYIIKTKKIIARTKDAISQADYLEKDANPFEIKSEIWEKVKRTFSWRNAQIENNQLEIRTLANIPKLENQYMEMEILDDILHLPEEESKFDPYLKLIQ